MGSSNIERSLSIAPYGIRTEICPSSTHDKSSGPQWPTMTRLTDLPNREVSSILLLNHELRQAGKDALLRPWWDLQIMLFL